MSLFTAAAVIHAVASRKSHGTFLGVPFEFRIPNVKRVRERWWNREDDRLFTPHVFGVGWSLNLYQARKKLGLLEEGADEDEEALS